MHRLHRHLSPALLGLCLSVAGCASGDTADQPNLTPQARLRVAEAAEAAGNTDLALSMYTAAADAAPDDIPLQLRCADALAGQSATAIAKFDEVLVARPADTSALVDKGIALDLQSHHAEAQRLYRQALVIAPGDATISNNLAVSLMIEGRTREAQLVLAPFADSDTAPARLKTNLGIIYAANGETEKAQQLLGGRLAAGELSTLTQAIAKATP